MYTRFGGQLGKGNKPTMHNGGKQHFALDADKIQINTKALANAFLEGVLNIIYILRQKRKG